MALPDFSPESVSRLEIGLQLFIGSPSISRRISAADSISDAVFRLSAIFMFAITLYLDAIAGFHSRGAIRHKG